MWLASWTEFVNYHLYDLIHPSDKPAEGSRPQSRWLENNVFKKELRLGHKSSQQ